MLRLAQSRLSWSSRISFTWSVAAEGLASVRARQSASGLSQRSSQPVRASAPTTPVASAPANSPYAIFLFIRSAAPSQRLRRGEEPLLAGVRRNHR